MGADPQGFVDPKLDDSVRDIQKSIDKKKFTIVSKEEDAEFLLVLLERKVEPRQNKFTGESRVGPCLYSTLSVRVDGVWKPGIKIRSSSDTWGNVAEDTLKQAATWLSARAK